MEDSGTTALPRSYTYIVNLFPTLDVFIALVLLHLIITQSFIVLLRAVKTLLPFKGRSMII